MKYRNDIFDVIRNGEDDEITLYDGYVLDRETLITNNIISENARLTGIFPIYIYGKHPVYDKSNNSITLNEILSTNSILYTNGAYNELCIYDVPPSSTNIATPKVGDKVKVRYDKTKDKIYANGYFSIVNYYVEKEDGTAIAFTPENIIKTTTSSTSSTSEQTQLSASDVRKGKAIFTSSTIGNFLYNNKSTPELIPNLCAICGQETSYKGLAIKDKVVTTQTSIGLFQLNVSINSDNIVNYLEFSKNYLIKLGYDEKLLKSTYTSEDWNNSLKNNIDDPVGIQIMAYMGYSNSQSNYNPKLKYSTKIPDNYLNILATRPISDPKVYQYYYSVQRFDSKFYDKNRKITTFAYNEFVKPSNKNV